MRRLLLTLVLPLTLSTLLGACAQLPGLTALDPGSARPPTRINTTGYRLAGRIAVRQGQQHHAANLTWQHSTDRDEILLTTPLGQGVGELTRDQAGAKLTTADKREFRAPDWQSLSAQVFGLALPLSALPRWLLAEVASDALGVKRDGLGRPMRMLVHDWQIAYLEYQGETSDALPSLIELKHDDIEVRLKVDEWQLSP